MKEIDRLKCIENKFLEVYYIKSQTSWCLFKVIIKDSQSPNPFPYAKAG